MLPIGLCMKLCLWCSIKIQKLTCFCWVAIRHQILKLRRSGVCVTGFVKDVKPYFDQVKTFVAPLRYGAGMKGKVGQSMSLGLPVVTTAIGAEG